MTEALFTPARLGDIQIANRVVMAPLTRNRADPETDAPHDLHMTYYRQRAGAGLIVTEGSQISPEGKAMPGRRGSTAPRRWPAGGR